MKNTLILGFSLILSLPCLAQPKVSEAECNRVIGNLVKFQNTLEKYKYDEKKALTVATDWKLYPIIVDEQPAPTMIEEVGGNQTVQPKKTSIKSVPYINENVLDVFVYSDAKTGLWEITPYENGRWNRAKVEAINELIKAKGKKIGDIDFLYMGYCFRMHGIMSLDTKGSFIMTAYKFYPNAFKLVYP